MLGGSPCPWCGHYNANDEARCGRCDQRLPPASLGRFLRRLDPESAPVTRALIAVNVVIFLLQFADGRALDASPTGSMPISTLLRFGALTNGLETAEPLRLLAACFVHMSAMHLLFNMMALWQLGRAGEAALGSTRLLVTYVLTGIAGFAVSGVWYALGEGGRPYITAGASGAIFGLTGLVVAGLAVRRDPRWKEILVQQLIYSFLMYYVLHTNQAAHLGGLVVGIGAGVLFSVESPRWRLGPVMAVAGAASTLAVIASLVAAQLSPLWGPVRAAEMARFQRRHGGEPRIHVD
ncbi:MAG: rhomboid family intramembrane serine protease [Myxococcales bacterium]|nr:MAG: rhomboid family intramembrane serine protease [Myxococcales bacterium]